MLPVHFLLPLEVLNVIFKLVANASLTVFLEEIRNIPSPAGLEEPAEAEGSDQQEEGEVEEKSSALEQLKSKYPTLVQDLQRASSAWHSAGIHFADCCLLRPQPCLSTHDDRGSQGRNYEGT